MRPNLKSIAAVLVFCLPSAAQDEAQPLLSPTEIKSLNKKVQEWIGAEMVYDRSSGRGRDRATKKRNRAREAFVKEWEKRLQKHDLLASVPDLEAIFANAFPYSSFKGMKSQLFAMGGKSDGPKWDVWVPKSYTGDSPYRVVVLLAGRSQERDGEWADGRDYFDATWKGAAILDDTIFIIPRLDSTLDFETVPDFSRPEEAENDRRRREALFVPAGLAQRELNFDRSRLILDCGKGTSRFGLRMVTYFPSRFAGLILRHPEDVDLRYDSLCGTRVALVANDETQGFAQQLHSRIEELAPGTSVLVEAEGEYPYGDLKDRLGEWVAGVQRNLYAHKVVIAPNHDLYHRSHWIQIGTAEPLGSVPPEDRPYLEAIVDREANKITINAKSVTDFNLYLNDAIVDLDEEVTVVVNGVANKQKRSREFSLLRKLVYDYFDPTMLFTVKWGMTVPDPN